MLYRINSLHVEMSYSEFRETVYEQIKELLSETHTVSLTQKEQNNGTTAYGFTIQKIGESLCVAAYLEEAYLHFLNGRTVNEIVGWLLGKIERSFESARKMQDSFEKINEQWREKIFYHLVNLESNQKMLEGMPHKIFHDYAIVFRIMLDEDWEYETTFSVRDERMEEWGVTIEELWNEAYRNTVKNFPMEICTIEQEVGDVEEKEVNPENGIMHVLSNEKRYYGAGVILYEGLLEYIGSMLKSDYYLLPSSLHEWMIVPKGIQSLTYLQNMVCDVNRVGVMDAEILGTKVYLYDREQQKLIVDPEE